MLKDSKAYEYRQKYEEESMWRKIKQICHGHLILILIDRGILYSLRNERIKSALFSLSFGDVLLTWDVCVQRTIVISIYSLYMPKSK